MTRRSFFAALTAIISVKQADQELLASLEVPNVDKIIRALRIEMAGKHYFYTPCLEGEPK